LTPTRNKSTFWERSGGHPNQIKVTRFESNPDNLIVEETKVGPYMGVGSGGA